MEQQYTSQLNMIADLNQTIKEIRTELDDKTIKFRQLNQRLTERDVEIANLRDFVARQSTELDKLEDQKKKVQQSFLEAQTESKISVTEKKHFQSQIAELESELLNKRKRVVHLEGMLVEFEKDKEELEARSDKLSVEVQSREKELSRCQELINALQEAHKKALDRSNHLNQQLDTLKQQNAALRREIEITLEREANERRDRTDV